MKNEVPSSENSKVKATKIPAPLPFRVFKSLLLFVPIVIVMIAIWLVFTGGFPTYFDPFDASSYPSGPIPELGSNMEYFGFGPDSLQPAIERIGPLKAINLEINNGDKVWSGLILSWGQNAAIPHNGTFDLQWRSSSEGYRVLIDLTVGGGVGLKGHIPERDGLFLGLTICEMMVKRERTLGELVKELFDQVGPHIYRRIDARTTEQYKQKVLSKLKKGLKEVAGHKVDHILTIDGYKCFFADGGWMLVRASGTEPLIRYYCEADSKEKVDKVLEAITSL